MHPCQLQRLLIGRTRHDFGGTTFQIGGLDIVIALDVQRIGQSSRRFGAHPKLVDAILRRIAIPVTNPRREIFSHIIRIQRLYSDAELRLNHRIHQIAQDLFCPAAREGFDEDDDVNHIAARSRRSHKSFASLHLYQIRTAASAQHIFRALLVSHHR